MENEGDQGKTQTQKRKGKLILYGWAQQFQELQRGIGVYARLKDSRKYTSMAVIDGAGAALLWERIGTHNCLRELWVLT